MKLSDLIAACEIIAGGPGSGRHKGDNAILYHGTTKDKADIIKEKGLRTKKGVSTVTTDKEYAKRAANQAAKDSGGKPAVITFKPSASNYFKSTNLGQDFGNKISDMRESGTRLIHPKHIDKIESGGPGSGRHPSGLSREEKLAKRRTELNQKRAVEREARKPFLSDKAKLAMKHMNVATKDIHDKAEELEDNVNKALKGSIKSNDNAPFDIVHTVNGKRHGVEVKAILTQKNDKITQKGEAINRKMAYAKANKIKGIHTVAVDYRGKTPVVYHKEGVGSFRLASMTKVKGGFNGLSKHIR